MKLKLTIFPLAFLVLTLSGFPVRSWASKKDDLMQECIKSPKHLIHNKKGDIYYACDYVSGVDDKSLASDTAESRARFRLGKVYAPINKDGTMTLSNTFIIDTWIDPKSNDMWALAQYTPQSPEEKKKLDSFINNKAPNGKNSGSNSQQLAKNVAKATGGVRQAFPSKKTATPNPPPSQGMGNLTPQATQGQPTSTSGAGSSAATNTSLKANPQNTDELPLLQKTKTPPETPPAPTTDKPKKSKPGFFAKIWNGIKKVAHYIATSRIATGLLLGAAAALMVTGFGAAPGVIIAAAVLGGGIGLAAGPLANSSPSKTLPPPLPIASSPANSSNPNPAPTTTAPNPPAVPTPPGGTISLNSGNVMTEANATAKSLNQNKPTEDETGSGLPPSAAVTPRNTNQNSLASNKPIPALKNIPKASSPYHKKPSAPSKKSVEAPKAGISVTKSAGYGAIVGGSAGLGLAAAGIISSPLWASAAIGVAAGAAVAAAGAAAWNYFKNKPTPAKPKVKPQKNQNAGDAPKTQALPKPPILGPQEM